MKPIVYAVVVTYYPRYDEFLPLIDELVQQTDRVIVVDNTDASDDRVFEILSNNNDIEHINIIRLGKNLGIAAALNIGIEAAITAGCTHILLSDQDSLPDSKMVCGLLRAESEILLTGVKVGAVGPVYVDQVTGIRFPFHVKEPKRLFYSKKQVNEEVPYISTISLITSGSLINAETIESVGEMCEDLFIDYVDVEWCHRAISKGFMLIGTNYGLMKHNMGNISLRIWFFGWHLVNGYGPTRLYYRVRNYIYLLKLSHVPLVWKICAFKDWLDSIYVHTFFASNRMLSLITMLWGLWDGIRGNMGINTRLLNKFFNRIKN